MLSSEEPLRILISVVSSFIFAGILKMIFRRSKKQAISIKTAFATGGMPSSHTAIVASLTTSIFLYEGFSTLFITSLFISLIVMSDAVGVRMETGKQAKALNSMLKTNKFNESAGHTPKEVIGGLAVGIITSLLFFFIRFGF